MRQQVLPGCVLVVITALCVVSAADEVAVDIGKSLRPGFAEIALLPTRLTYYNMHEDAAIASYTCCKPWQEEEIRKAAAANASYLDNYYDTDYADDTLLHNAYINSVRRNFRHQVASLEWLVDEFPDSDLADDGLYQLARCYMFDKDHGAAIDTLYMLVRNWPDSVWADDALMYLARELREVEDHNGAWAALEELAENHPSSDYTPQALDSLASRAAEDEDYDEAIAISERLLDEYNCSDFADDAQFRIADSLRHLGDLQAALDSYLDLIERLPGSRLSNRAMREANSIARQARRAGHNTEALYDTTEFNPGRDAQELYDLARHWQNYREYSAAIDAYRDFVDGYPGHDNFDDALFNIGVCYQQMNMLFQDINKSKGPDDIFRFAEEYQDATGAYGSLPTAGELSAVNDATSAFAVVVNNLVGSPLRDDALYEIAKSFEDSERMDDMVYTYQELVIHFPTSKYHFEALYETLKYYADAKNWDAAQDMFRDLAAAYPGIFPEWLLNNRLNFYTVIGAYFRHSDFAWFEAHHHHIPYHFTVADLAFDADFYLGALALSNGDYKDAVTYLEPLAKMPTNDLCVPAKWMLARTYELWGKMSTAEKYYNNIIAHHARSGLADDAHLALENLGKGEALAEYRQKFKDLGGPNVDNFDWYIGENVVVFAPFTVSAKMRQYNMPNIWENAEQILSEWVGLEEREPQLICVDPSNRRAAGKLVRLSAAQIKDPPRWSLGLAQLAENAIATGSAGKFAGKGKWITEGLASFASASLQYDLVTETRDAIGSATAVKLPQEEVLRARQRALESLTEYVRAGSAPENVNATVLCGMLFHLLDVQGYSQNRLIDREPYGELFANLRRQPGSGLDALAGALDANFDGAAGEQLRQWKLPVRGRVAQKSQ
jgi:TolA-binding protein